MSAIDYSDNRDNVWMPLCPQSWLTGPWLTIAQDQDWHWIKLICGNACQVFAEEQATELLAQLNALRSAVNESRSIEQDLIDRMTERLDKAIPAVAHAAANWGDVEMISIG